MHDPEGDIRRFMQNLGLDVSDPHLKDTPRRIVAMYRDELFHREEVKITTFPAETTGMIVERDIEFVSVCAHHFVPFRGKAHVGYIPRKTMLGLSKLARIVEYHAHAPQVQERMTEQIADHLEEALSTPDAIHGRLDPVAVGVVIEAEHLCMSMRGVRKHGMTITSALRGAFMAEPGAREEFLSLVRQH